MELPWVLLALAGTGAATGLGDSPGGDGGSEGMRGGLRGRAWLGGPHTGAVSPVLAPPASREPCARGPQRGRWLGSGSY